MSTIFWIKDYDTGEYRPDGIAQSKTVPVTRDTPFPVQIVHPEDNDYPAFEIKGEEMPPVAGRSKKFQLQIPGIGTAAAYADGEAFGTAFILHNVFRAERPSGWITGARLADLDDEGIQIDVALFSAPIAAPTDNSAFAPTDVELATCVGVVSIDTFANWSVNQYGQSSAAPMHVVADGPNLYAACISRGAPNIAAGAIPILTIYVTPD